jgi:general secretion pathway protein G
LYFIVAFLLGLTAIGVWYIVDVRPREREVRLKQELKKIRRLIDQYALDKHQLPRSFDDLVQAGYVREIPIDPITQKRDWHIKMGEDTVSRAGGIGNG